MHQSEPLNQSHKLALTQLDSKQWPGRREGWGRGSQIKCDASDASSVLSNLRYILEALASVTLSDPSSQELVTLSLVPITKLLDG